MTAWTRVPVPANEKERLRELERYSFLATPPEAEFDRITRMAARLLHCPVAAITFIAEDKQWLKSCIGLPVFETSREFSICTWTILTPEVMVVPDVREDQRFACNPLLQRDDGARFYAGAPLITPRGCNIGSLCVIDMEPRPAGLTEQEEATLVDLAAMVISELELRLVVQERGRTEATLRLSEERLSLALEASGVVGTWDWNVDNDRLVSDSRFAALFGVDPERAAKGVALAEFTRTIHPDDVEAVKTQIAEAIRTLGLFVMEYRVLQRDGSVRWVHSRGRCRHGADGSALRFPGIAVDVTERKLIEAEREQLLLQLRLEHDRTNQILESISDAFYAVDSEFRFTYVNNAACELWGRQAADLHGRHMWTEFARAVDTDSHRMHLKAMAERKPVRYETVSPIIARWIDVSIYPEAGGGLSCYFRDLTERKRAEQALRETEERFSAAFAEAPVGMLLTTPEGKFIEANPAFLKMLGYSRDELLGHDSVRITHADDVPATRDFLAELRRGRTSAVIEKRYLRKDGLPLWARASVTMRRDHDGRPTQVIAVVEDITERKRAGEERERLLRELERSNADLAQFAHVVAHDLQSPLRMVRSYAQLLDRRINQQMDHASRQFMGTVLDGAERMDGLIGALLNYAQVGQEQHTRSAVHIDAVLAGALSNLEPLIIESGADVLHEPLPVVNGDAIQLLQLFQNLVANAIKYRRSGVTPSVRISAVRAGGEWTFLVADNGEGITSGDREKIFQPLQRLHGPEVPGTGMGLAVCRKIVERHGGRIWVESGGPAQGSTFKFTLPE